jgi:hypothetical protein
MKHPGKAFFAAVLVMALSAAIDAQAGGSAGATATPKAGTGSMTTPNKTDYGSRDAAGAYVGPSPNSPTSPTTNRSRDKTNGLNKGTNSGANSDVNRGFNHPRQTDQ